MGIVDTLKDVVTLVQKTDNIELVKRLLSLQAQALEMQEENRALHERTKELERALDFAKSLRFEAGLRLLGMRRLLIIIALGLVGLLAIAMLRAPKAYPEIPVSRLVKDFEPYLCVRGVVDSEAVQGDGSWSYALVDVETGERVTVYQKGLWAGLRRPEIHFVSSACGPVQNFPVMPGISGVHLVGPVESWRGPQSLHPIDWLRAHVHAKR